MTLLPYFYCVPFILIFSCLIALVCTSSTVLNRSSKCGHPYLLFALKEKAFNLWLEYDINGGLFSCDFYCVEVKHSFTSVTSLLHVSTWNDFEFCQIFFSISWDGHMVTVLPSTNVMHFINWFLSVEPSLPSTSKSNLVMVTISLLVFCWGILQILIYVSSFLVVSLSLVSA